MCHPSGHGRGARDSHSCQAERRLYYTQPNSAAAAGCSAWCVLLLPGTLPFDLLWLVSFALPDHSGQLIFFYTAQSRLIGSHVPVMGPVRGGTVVTLVISTTETLLDAGCMFSEVRVSAQARM